MPAGRQTSTQSRKERSLARSIAETLVGSRTEIASPALLESTVSMEIPPSWVAVSSFWSSSLRDMNHPVLYEAATLQMVATWDNGPWT
mmetsp:Transcript_21650/g.88318  ORF Transcript_21650/g.88318 Transcript_21650/m.88318 type:complete len:88 (+) Transcript_21650:2511-2774(+)